MSFFFLFSLSLVGFTLGQFDFVTDEHTHRMLKDAGHYRGDVFAEWGAESKKALREFAAPLNMSFSDDLYRPQDDWYFKTRVGQWIVEHDVASIKPRSVGVFFVQFNKEKCDATPADADCALPSTDRALDYLFRAPEENACWYFNMTTRGLHRFYFGGVHHLRLSQDKTHSMDIPLIARDVLRFNPAERYARRVYIYSKEYTGLGPGTAGMASGQDTFFKVTALSNFMHELGHTLGLGHNGVMKGGRFDEYSGSTSFMSGAAGGFAANAPELDWLRVITHNTLMLTASARQVKLKSLTSLSEGYKAGDGFGPISGHVAALYKSPGNGPEYFVEWREPVRQDKHIEPQFKNVLIIQHRRDRARTTEVDAALKVGASWTSPRGDLTITHTGPVVGTFDVTIGPVVHHNVDVKAWRVADYIPEFQERNKPRR